MISTGIEEKFNYDSSDAGKIWASEWNKVIEILNHIINSGGSGVTGSTDLLTKSVEAFVKHNLYTTTTGVMPVNNTYILTRAGFIPGLETLTEGMTLIFRTDTTNVGTINVPKIKIGDLAEVELTFNGETLPEGYIVPGYGYLVTYTGGNFVILNDLSHKADLNGDQVQFFKVKDPVLEFDAVNLQTLKRLLNENDPEYLNAFIKGKENVSTIDLTDTEFRKSVSLAIKHTRGVKQIGVNILTVQSNSLMLDGTDYIQDVGNSDNVIALHNAVTIQRTANHIIGSDTSVDVQSSVKSVVGGAVDVSMNLGETATVIGQRNNVIVNGGATNTSDTVIGSDNILDLEEVSVTTPVAQRSIFILPLASTVTGPSHNILARSTLDGLVASVHTSVLAEVTIPIDKASITPVSLFKGVVIGDKTNVRGVDIIDDIPNYMVGSLTVGVDTTTVILGNSIKVSDPLLKVTSNIPVDGLTYEITPETAYFVGEKLFYDSPTNKWNIPEYIDESALEDKMLSLNLTSLEDMYISSHSGTVIEGIENLQVRRQNLQTVGSVYTYPASEGGIANSLSMHTGLTTGFMKLTAADHGLTDWFCLGTLNTHIVDNAIAQIDGVFFSGEQGYYESVGYTSNKSLPCIEIIIARYYNPDNGVIPAIAGETNPFTSMNDYVNDVYAKMQLQGSVTGRYVKTILFEHVWSMNKRDIYIKTIDTGINGWMNYDIPQTGMIFARLINRPAISNTIPHYKHGECTISTSVDTPIEEFMQKIDVHSRITDIETGAVLAEDGSVTMANIVLSKDRGYNVFLDTLCTEPVFPVVVAPPTLTTLVLKKGVNNVAFNKVFTIAELHTMFGVGNIFEIRGSFSRYNTNIIYYKDDAYTPSTIISGITSEVNTLLQVDVGRGYLITLRSDVTVTYDADELGSTYIIPMLTDVGNHYWSETYVRPSDPLYVPGHSAKQTFWEATAWGHVGNISGRYSYRMRLHPILTESEI